MTSNYHYTIDLNKDQNHQPFFCTLRSQDSSSLSSTLSSIPFLNSNQDHGGYVSHHSDQSQHFQPQEEATQKSKTGLKLKIRKEEENDQNQRSGESNSSSVKGMSSKMRMMDKPKNNWDDFDFDEDQKQRSQYHSDPIINGDIIYHNGQIRVCSDCSTTKTPLWRSGPQGPKSLCNACGIRQRKARRAAMAAAAAVNGTAVVDAPMSVKETHKVQNKNKKPRNEQEKKKYKLPNSSGMSQKKSSSTTTSSKKLCFDDLTMILSQNSAFQQVFPQDEKEAAILLMALSYGMVRV